MVVGIVRGGIKGKRITTRTASRGWMVSSQVILLQLLLYVLLQLLRQFVLLFERQSSVVLELLVPAFMLWCMVLSMMRIFQFLMLLLFVKEVMDCEPGAQFSVHELIVMVVVVMGRNRR